MAPVPANLKNGSPEIDKVLDLAKSGRETARRHQAEVYGKDVDPSRCFADFLLTLKDAGLGNRPTQVSAQRRLETFYKTAMVETSGPLGGYLVPPDFKDSLMRDIAGLSLVRPRATVIPMTSRTTYLPTLDATTLPTANGVAPFWGGLRMQFALEGQARAETEPAFRQVELTAFELGGYALCSNPLMQDGLAIESWLRAAFARSAAWYEDWFFINGNGAGQPLGVINSAASVLVTRNTASHFKVQDAQSMLSSLYMIDQPVWAISQTANADIVGLTGWIPNGLMALYGAPVVSTLKQPALGTKGDVIVADWGLYVIGDRNEISIDVSYDEPTAMLRNQAVWRVVERLAGAPWISAPIDIPDANVTGTPSTCSPFVVLL